MANTQLFPQSFGLFLLVFFGIFALLVFLLILLKKTSSSNSVDKLENAIMEKRFKEAISIGEHLLEKKVDGLFVQTFLGQAYYKTEKYEKAIEALEKAAVFAKNQNLPVHLADAYLKIGNIYRKLDRPTDAVGYYSFILQEFPHHKQALVNLSECFLMIDKPLQAKKHLENLLSYNPSHPHGNYLLGKIEHALGFHAEAAKYLQKALNAMLLGSYEFIQTSLLLSESYSQKHFYKDAAEILQPLLNDKDTREMAVTRIYTAYLNDRNPSAAEHFLMQHKKEISKTALAGCYYKMAEMLFKHGCYFPALEFWKQTYDTDKKFQDVADIMKRYEILWKNPALHTYFSREIYSFLTFIEKSVGAPVSMEKKAIEKDFAVLQFHKSLYIFYRRPVILDAATLDRISKTFEFQVYPEKSVLIFSLFGLTESCREHFIFPKLYIFGGHRMVEMLLQNHDPKEEIKTETPGECPFHVHSEEYEEGFENRHPIHADTLKEAAITETEEHRAS